MRVPVSPVPRLQRYYEGATTSRSRIDGRLWFRSRGPRDPSVVRVSPTALPVGAEVAVQAGALFRRLPRPAVSHMDASGISQVLQATHPVPLPCSRTPAEPRVLAMTAHSMLPPHSGHSEGFGDNDFGANPQALVPAAYASRAALPHPCKARFRLAGCAFAGRASNPLDRYERFQLVVTSVLLSCSPDATGTHNHRSGVMDSGVLAFGLAPE